MKITVKTKDGTVHETIDGKFVPPITVPENLLREIYRVIFKDEANNKSENK